MRIAVVGAGVLASLVFASLVAALAPRAGFAQRAVGSSASGGSGLIALSASVDEGHQQVTVVDPATRVVGVYHIDLSTGVVELKSVRNIHWDLQMMEFNGAGPLPSEVRSILEQQ